MKIDRKKFFDQIRTIIHHGAITDEQVRSYDAILDEAEAYPVPVPHSLAYVFATVLGEVGYRYQPIHEIGQRSYFDKYNAGTTIGNRLGNTQPGDGFLYRGRGFVQLTGRRNYAVMSIRLGINLTDNPDKALDTKVAAKIIITGMMEGIFTGKKLSDYINSKMVDYRNARRIINGTDKADEFAARAVKYQRAIEEALVADDKKGEVKEASGTVKITKPAPVPPVFTVPPPSAPTPVPPEKPRVSKEQWIIGTIAAAIAAVFAWVFSGGQ
jgi:putative chitinase